MHKHHDIGEKCFGMYLGTVVQHLTHGQLKVYIQGIYPAEWANTPSNLPICTQVSPQFAGSHDGNGSFSYPNIGSTVVCFFANGDQNYPMTIGSILGGMNAFGQYEHIKTNSEISSTRHLITAGKSHYEMYESGKISAIVVQPIRTQAEVSYGSEIDSPLSIDAVTSRPICEQVDNEEISSIDCQCVLDSEEKHGTISSSTRYFDPTSYSKTTVLSAEQKTIFEKSSGTNKTSSYSIVDNTGHRELGQVSALKSSFVENVTDLANQSNANTIIALTADIQNDFKHNIDGSMKFSTLSSVKDVYNYSYYNNATKQSVLSTHNLATKGDSSCGYGIDTSFWMAGQIDLQGTSNYTNSQTGDQKSNNIKSQNRSSIASNGKCALRYEVLSSSKLSETDVKVNLMMHTNKHDASSVIDQSSENGITIDSDWKDDDNSTIGSTSIQMKQDNFAHFDMLVGEKPSIKIESQRKYTKTMQGNQQDFNVICQQEMSPTDKTFYFKIFNQLDHTGCTIEMDAKGNMTLSATKSITITAPTVDIKGQTMTQQFKTLTQTASTINIKGNKGDCKIKNVSLLNHKHYETQAGDVVSPQPTKIASQSN